MTILIIDRDSRIARQIAAVAGTFNAFVDTIAPEQHRHRIDLEKKTIVEMIEHADVVVLDNTVDHPLNGGEIFDLVQRKEVIFTSMSHSSKPVWLGKNELLGEHPEGAKSELRELLRTALNKVPAVA